MDTTGNNNQVPTQFYYKKSRIQQLKGFCATVKEGTSLKASKKLNLDPSTISMQIKSLESDLGIKLFTRTPNHRLGLTKQGQEFYNIASVQLRGMDSLFARFHSDLKYTNKSIIVIAGYYTALSYILPEYIKRLVDNKEFSNIKIKLCNISKEEAFKRLVEGEVDFAFYPSIEQDIKTPVEIQQENIFKLKNALFCHKSHPLASKEIITKEDIEKHEYLQRDKYEFYNPISSMNINPSNIKFENSNNYTTLGLVKKGLGFGIGDEIYKNDNKVSSQDIVFINIDNIFPTMFYSLFTLKNKEEKASTKFIINELKKDSDIN